MRFVRSFLTAAVVLPSLILALPESRSNPTELYQELKARQADAPGLHVADVPTCEFCKYGDNPQSPLRTFEWCFVYEFPEKEQQYFGMCFNEGPDVVRRKDNIKALDQPYVDEVTNFLAYFALAKSPGFCAGQGVVDDVSKDVARAVSRAVWHTAIERDTAHVLLVGLNYLVAERQEVQPNLGHGSGVAFARLHKIGEYFFAKQAPIVFHDDDDKVLCHQDKGPTWIANNAAGYAPGHCTFHITHYQVPRDPKDDSERQYAIELNLFDANGFVIGWQNKVFSPEPVFVSSKLPYGLVVTTGPPYGDDAPVTFDYGGQRFDSNDENHCKFGAYDNNKREGDCGFTCD